MHINITNLKPNRTGTGYPKVTFTVWFCDKVDAKLVPKYSQEGWSLYVNHRAKSDDRGVVKTRLCLPQVPWVRPGAVFGGKYLTINEIDEELFDAIHEYVATRPAIKKWMAMKKLEKEYWIKDKGKKPNLSEDEGPTEG